MTIIIIFQNIHLQQSEPIMKKPRFKAIDKPDKVSFIMSYIQNQKSFNALISNLKSYIINIFFILKIISKQKQNSILLKKIIFRLS